MVYGFVLGFLVGQYAFLPRRWDAGARTAAIAGIIVWTSPCLNNVVVGFSVVALVWIFAEMTVAGLLTGRLFSKA